MLRWRERARECRSAHGSRRLNLYQGAIASIMRRGTISPGEHAMTIEDLFSIVLTVLIIAFVLVRVRGLMLAYPHSLNPVKAYRDRRDVVESARKNHPHIFGKRK